MARILGCASPAHASDQHQRLRTGLDEGRDHPSDDRAVAGRRSGRARQGGRGRPDADDLPARRAAGHGRGDRRVPRRRVRRPRDGSRGPPGRAAPDLARASPPFILKYRLGPRYHHPAMQQDVLQAIRYARWNADEFGIRKDRIGVMGFSAGGHLASTAATLFDAGKPSIRGADRRRQQPPRFRRARLPRDHDEPGEHPQGLAAQPARRQPAARAAGEALHRQAGHGADAADIPLPHERGRRRAGGEQRAVLSRAPQGGRARRAAHLPEGRRTASASRPPIRALRVWPELLFTWMEGLGVFGK